MALTIPTINKGNFELLNDNMKLVASTLSDQKKAEIAQFTWEKQQREKDKKLRDVMFRANHPRLAKAKDLITKGWEKLIKMKWFDKITGFFKSMISNASGWIQTLTAVIFLLKSGILQQLIPWVLQIGVQLLQTIIKWTPTILKFVWNIITRTVPALLKGLFNTIFDTIGLPKDHPIRQFFNFVFDNFPKFADLLLKTFVDIFLAIGSAIGKVYDAIKPLIPLIMDKLKPMFDSFVVIFKTIWDSGSKLVKNLFGDLLQFFNDLQTMSFGEAFKNLVKNIVVDLGTFFADVIPKIIDFLLVYIKTIGPYILDIILTPFKILDEFVMKANKFLEKSTRNFLFKTIPNALGKAVKFIISPFEAVFKKIVDIFDPIRKLVSSLSNMGDIGEDVKEKAKGFASGVYEKFISNPVSWVKNLFKGIVDGIKEIPKNIIKSIQGAFDWVIALFGLVGEVLSDPVKNFKMLSKENFSLNLKKRMTSLQEEREKKESYQNYKTGTKLSRDEYEKTVNPKERKKWDAETRTSYVGGSPSTEIVGYTKNREKGGPVEAGNSYIVNEGKKGELFVPSTDGNITSNKEIKEMVDLMKKMVSILERGSNPQPTPSFTPLARAR